LLDGMISKVDDRIRKSIVRIEAPMPDSFVKSLNDQIDSRPTDMREQTLESLEALDKKIDYYLQQAEKLGEDGQIEESEALVKEIDRMKIQKQELETSLEDPTS
jgi:hypothetical protein